MDTLVHLLRRSAETWGEAAALSQQVGLRRVTWSYQMLEEAADGVAYHLRSDRGLSPGTRIIIWEPNSPELVAAMFGAMVARLVLVPIDPSATPEFVGSVAEATEAELIVSSIPGAPAASVAVGDLLTHARHERLPDAPLPDDTAEIVFTSGTTGSPKGVMLTHRNIVSNVGGVLAMFPSRPLRLVSLLPLSHMLEQTVGLYAPLAMGSAIHYPGTRRPSALLKAMRRTRVTTMVLVPQVLEMMFSEFELVALQKARRRWVAAHRIAPLLPMSLRRALFAVVHRQLGGRLAHMMCGGAALERGVAAAWERLGVRVIEGYGTTECAPVVSGHTYWDRCRGSVGSPLPGVGVSLSSDGEILVRGPNVFRGYWDDERATRAAFDSAGWYRTGDLGSWDDHGHLRITGRLSDRIVLPSGMNVYPDDVESALIREPAIAECVVLAVDDGGGKPRLGVVAIPVFDARGVPASLADVEEAVGRASRRLAPHQRPTTVSLWQRGEFPRTNLMKVKRHEVLAAVQRDEPALPPAPIPPGDSRRDLRRVVASIAGIDPALVHGSSDLTVDVGLDSLAMLQLAVALEEQFGVVIDDGELADLHSVDALAEMIADGGPRAEIEASWTGGARFPSLRALLQHMIVFPLHRLVARPFVTRGTENLRDSHGPCLFIANHSSHTDTPSILRALPPRIRRRTAVAAATDYFYRTRIRGALVTILLGTFPFSREGEVRSSFERCGELADGGMSILIYPEGTRSTTGRMSPFRAGIGLLARELRLPVVPIGLTGTFHTMPKGSRFPRSGPIAVTFGAPIRIEPDEDPLRVVDQLERAVVDLVDSAPAGVAGA